MNDFVTEMEHEMKPKLPANTSEGFPRYQLSKFLAGSKDYQIVVRANSQEEFEGAMKEIKPFITALEGNLHTPKNTSTPQNDVMERKMTSPKGSNCPKCGAEMIHNPRTGKWFCKDKCWLQG